MMTRRSPARAEAFERRRLGLGLNALEKIPKILPDLEAEGIVLLPTDTIYGISCRWDSRQARERIHHLKGQEPLAFFVALVSDLGMAFQYAEEPSDACRRILQEEWPGPVTAVLRARPDRVPEFCGSPEGTVAFRWPENDFLQELIARLGAPIVSTSANRTGEPHAGSAEEAWEIFGEGIDLYVDAGPQEALPSTLVDLTGEEPVLLRVGVRALRGMEDRREEP